ncbi:MAG TPA: ABC transporter ATP-binding protein [Candidatus Brocadiia bacterium]|nr:ABC transporter ATP-binding protein [Candidatus Brocadiia bacterium]
MATAPEARQWDRNGNEAVIEVRDLVKIFQGRKVLDGVNLKVYRGETVTIMGGSGCGKTTLLRCIVGAYKPEAGGSSLFGNDIAKITPDELSELRKRIGVVFQTGALFQSMTVGENIALLLREHTELDDAIIDIIVKMKLEMVGLRDAYGLMPAQLSGGMSKRVGIARAISLDPDIVFYDEPTTGLDPIMAGVMNQLIMGLADNMRVTSVVVTHDMNSAFKVSDRLIMLHEGKVVADGTADEIRLTRDPIVRQFVDGLPDGPIPLRRSRVPYIEDILG